MAVQISLAPSSVAAQAGGHGVAWCHAWLRRKLNLGWVQFEQNGRLFCLQSGEEQIQVSFMQAAIVSACGVKRTNVFVVGGKSLEWNRFVLCILDLNVPWHV